MNETFRTIETDYPGLYQAADRKSITSQQTYYKGLSFYLIFLILGTIITLFLDDSKFYAILAAFSFLASLFLSTLMLFRRFDKTWYSARAVAESVKTRSWRYMMKSEPYGITDKEAKQAFLKDIREILDQNKAVTGELCDESATHNAISLKMEQIRAMTLEDRIAYYKSSRVEEQRDWYSKKAIINKRQGFKWVISLTCCNILAVLCVLLRMANPSWSYIPTALFAVAAACIVSWMQSKRFSELSTSYSLTAHEISIILSQIDLITNEEMFSDFVNDTENAFSREHTQWIARRTGH